MKPFYLILSLDKETGTWNPGMFLYKTEEEAEQSFWKLTDDTKGKHKIIKVTQYETIDEIENDCSEEDE